MIRALIPLLALAAPLAGQVKMTDGPVTGQLYPRDLVTNEGVVRLAGEASDPAYSSASLLVTQDGAIWTLESVNLVYVNGVAGFAFEVPIEAGLHRYRFRLRLTGPFSYEEVGVARDVVCGDAFLIQGQSNAVAGDAHGEALANHMQSAWVRSYGTAKASSGAATVNRTWYAADGEGQTDKGTVGAWGLRMGKLLVDRYGVPVAILNGALGATPIQWHQRDDAAPANPDTIYGRLLYRARGAGLAERARALIWYQGEANGSLSGYDYFRQFQMLRRDWLEDYPALERIYLFQVREGCGVADLEIRESQRQLADWFADVTVMSTNAAPGHDGCHYAYAGYRELGDRITRLVARDLYLEPSANAVEAPNVWGAQFTSPVRDEIRVTGRDPHQALTVDHLAYRHFALDAPERVIGVTLDGPDLLLQLTGPTAAAHVAYRGHSGPGPWITNSYGVGLLSFQLPIQP